MLLPLCRHFSKNKKIEKKLKWLICAVEKTNKRALIIQYMVRFNCQLDTASDYLRKVSLKDYLDQVLIALVDRRRFSLKVDCTISWFGALHCRREQKVC